nr:hypothetical protein [Tanacetum cinerariifolium]
MGFLKEYDFGSDLLIGVLDNGIWPDGEHRWRAASGFGEHRWRAAGFGYHRQRAAVGSREHRRRAAISGWVLDIFVIL